MDTQDVNESGKRIEEEKGENRLTEADRNITQVFKSRVKTILPVRDLLVFGSRARGDATDESDLDVFIEVETLTKPLRERIFELAWEVGFEMDRVISTIVVTHDGEIGNRCQRVIHLKDGLIDKDCFNE